MNFSRFEIKQAPDVHNLQNYRSVLFIAYQKSTQTWTNSKIIGVYCLLLIKQAPNVNNLQNYRSVLFIVYFPLK